MADNDVYRKTDKGRNEIATRENRLGLRERALLILVDDKTTREGLLAKNSHPSSGGLLDLLLDQGFIEIDVSVTLATTIAAPPASLPVAAVSAPPSAVASGQPQAEVSMNSASKFACRTLLTYLGPGAGAAPRGADPRSGGRREAKGG